MARAHQTHSTWLIPSLPGLRLFRKADGTRLEPVSTPVPWATLMQRLGYTKFRAQGGDWGNAVSEVMALAAAAGIARHPHQHGGDGSAGSVQRAFNRRPAAGRPFTEDSTPGINWISSTEGTGYAIEMNNRPQTLYGIVDSPVGLAAWMLDHDARSQEMIARVFNGKTKDCLATTFSANITLYG